MNGDRMSRVNELIKSVLAENLTDVLELPPDNFITITRVVTSRDLSHAKIFVTLFPDEKKDELSLKLTEATHELKHLLAHNTSIRKVPDLTFVFDDTEEKASHIEGILDQL